MRWLVDFLGSVLGMVLSLAPLVGLIYLFRLNPDSRRHGLVADAVRIAYLVLLGLLTYAVNSMGACTGCGLALFGFVTLGFGITVAGMRMDRLWANKPFWLVSALGVLVSSSWFLAGANPSGLSEFALVLIPAAVAAFTLVGLSWPIGKYVASLIPVRERQRKSARMAEEGPVDSVAADSRRRAELPAEPPMAGGRSPLAARRKGILGWLAVGCVALGMIGASVFFEETIASSGRKALAAPFVVGLLWFLSIVPYVLGVILGIAGILTGESRAKPIIAIVLGGFILVVWGYFLWPVISR